MSRKTLTRDCPSCNKLFIDDNNNFVCQWGKARNQKILDETKGSARPLCNLLPKNKKVVKKEKN
jgi:hypothetical protein